MIDKGIIFLGALPFSYSSTYGGLHHFFLCLGSHRDASKSEVKSLSRV